MPNWKKVVTSGSNAELNALNLSGLVNANTDTDKFLVLDATGNVDYRTGAEVLSDIGAGGATLNLQQVTDNGRITSNPITITGQHEVGSGSTALNLWGNVTSSYTALGFGSRHDVSTLSLSVNISSGSASPYHSNISSQGPLTFNSRNYDGSYGKSLPGQYIFQVNSGSQSRDLLRIQPGANNWSSGSVLISNINLLPATNDALYVAGGVTLDLSNREDHYLKIPGVVDEITAYGSLFANKKLLAYDSSSGFVFYTSDVASQTSVTALETSTTALQATSSQLVYNLDWNATDPFSIEWNWYDGSNGGFAQNTILKNIVYNATSSIAALNATTSSITSLNAATSSFVSSHGGAATQLAVWDTNSSISGSNGLVWDNAGLTVGRDLYVDGTSTTVVNFTASNALIDGNANFSGNVIIGGTLTAQQFNTEYVSSSIIYESGSTKFGDTNDDIHQFTGSLRVKGPITGSDLQINGFSSVSASLASLAASAPTLQNVLTNGNDTTLAIESTNYIVAQQQNLWGTNTNYLHTTFTSGSTIADSTSQERLFTFSTTVYESVHIEYVVFDSGRNNKRTGTAMATWGAGQIQYTEVSTLDIGDTSGFSIEFIDNSGNVDLVVSNSTGQTMDFRYYAKGLYIT